MSEKPENISSRYQASEVFKELLKKLQKKFPNMKDNDKWCSEQADLVLNQIGNKTIFYLSNKEANKLADEIIRNTEYNVAGIYSGEKVSGCKVNDTYIKKIDSIFPKNSTPHERFDAFVEKLLNSQELKFNSPADSQTAKGDMVKELNKNNITPQTFTKITKEDSLKLAEKIGKDTSPNRYNELKLRESLLIDRL